MKTLIWKPGKFTSCIDLFSTTLCPGGKVEIGLGELGAREVVVNQYTTHSTIGKH